MCPEFICRRFAGGSQRLTERVAQGRRDRDKTVRKRARNKRLSTTTARRNSVTRERKWNTRRAHAYRECEKVEERIQTHRKSPAIHKANGENPPDTSIQAEHANDEIAAHQVTHEF